MVPTVERRDFAAGSFFLLNENRGGLKDRRSKSTSGAPFLVKENWRARRKGVATLSALASAVKSIDKASAGFARALSRRPSKYCGEFRTVQYSSGLCWRAPRTRSW